jgi:hypothetical protein
MLKERHFYIITSTGPIGPLGGISGPVKAAIVMKPYDAYCCVKEGHTVYEVNEFDHREKVLVTRDNYNHITFKTSKVEMIKRKRMLEEIRGIKREPKLSSSKKDVKADKKKKLEENEGKSDIAPQAKVEESAFKVTDFQKQ